MSNTAEKMAAMFPDDDPAYLNFDAIPPGDRLHQNRRLCGLLKVVTLMLSPASFDFCAEHDILYLAQISDLTELTPADAEYLSRCGIHWDSEAECLATFC